MSLSEKFWTLPNCVTLYRMFFGAPVTMWIFIFHSEFAWFVFLLFVLTDWLDGLLARRLKQESGWGVKLDPLADQCLVLPLVWMFYFAGEMLFFVPVFLTGREVLMVLLRFFSKTDIPANIFGKTKVAAEYIGILLLLAGGVWFYYGLLMFIPIIFLAAASFIKYSFDFFMFRPKQGLICLL